jgi:hypothetical protein
LPIGILAWQIAYAYFGTVAILRAVGMATGCFMCFSWGRNVGVRDLARRLGLER